MASIIAWARGLGRAPALDCALQGGCMSQANDDNLIWIDLEMTGLDTDNDSILEIATVVTDKNLNVLADGPVFAIRHEIDRLESMDSWNINQHHKSGLWRQGLNSQTEPAMAEPATVEGPGARAP